ncbi:hypothetical protein [Belnapia mucosa]|nr:hypothetical protein [Belnapia mucosa]
MRAALLLGLLLLAACQSGGGSSSGPYIGGSVGTNLREDQRLR